MEHPTNCILVARKMSIFLSHDNANLKTFAFVTNLGIEILIVPSHRTHRLQELDVIAFGLWDDLVESRTKEAKIRNTEEMYIIARFEYIAQLLVNSQVFCNDTPCRPLSLAVVTKYPLLSYDF